MILIVEDDLEIQNTLKDLLEIKGYPVLLSNNTKDALSCIDSHINMVIIDIQLPDGNGITLCQQIRQISKVPIIFLTAKNDEETIVEALNSGGDDYICKPFRANELIARINSLSRRTQSPSYIIQSGDLIIDTKNYKVLKNNEEVILTAIGYEILFSLVKYRGMVITRERMIEMIEKQTKHEIEDNTVSVHMKRLREKLGTYHSKNYIETVRGIGYRWKD